MAKTYNTFTNVSTGDVYTAASHNAILQNLAGYRVPPLCLLRKSSAQSLTDGAMTYLTWSAAEEIYDTDGMHDTSTNTSRITPTTAGLYVFTFTEAVTAVPTVYNIAAIRINAGDFIAYQQGGAVGYQTTVGVAYMNGSTDYVEAGVLISGAGRTINIAAGVQTNFSAAWLGQVS